MGKHLVNTAHQLIFMICKLLNSCWRRVHVNNLPHKHSVDTVTLNVSI